MKKGAIILFILCSYFSNGQILAERERADVIDQILADRFNNLLPQLMDKTDFDMWILISR